MTDAAQKPWPVEIRLNPLKNILVVEYDSGERFALAAEYLRVESPSAEVQGHGAGQKQIVTGKQNVTIDEMEPVGNYAVRLRFDDGHDTGLYSWDYLHELGREFGKRWAIYTEAVKQGR
jgi:DUF971 family protein